MLGEKLILQLTLGVLFTFGLVVGACAPTSESAYNQIVSCLDEATNDMNRGQVYLNNNQFEEARKCSVDAQVHLSDIKVLLDKGGLTEVEQNDASLAISWMSEGLIGINKLIDVLEAMKTRDDWLTWGPYHEIVNSLIEARDRLAKAQEISSNINDVKLEEDISELNKAMITIDESLEALQTEQMLGAVKIFTYIFKIDTESVRDLAIEITRGATSDKEEVTKIFNYVRDNIKYVKDPRYTELDFDYIQSSSQTLDRHAGDCDDHSVLLASLLESVGYGTKICFVDTDGKAPLEANHMNVIVTIDKTEYILEATCKTCKMGEYPGKMYYEGYDYSEFKTIMQQAMSEAKKSNK